MTLITRKASVHWKGAKGGIRAVTTESGILNQTKISLGLPHKSGPNTDPAELIAAAHASSFSLALSNELGLKDFSAGEILTTATVTMEHEAAGWAIMGIHLNVVARLLKMSQGSFIDATVRAKTNCLVSKALRPKISMNAKLEKPAPKVPLAVGLR